MLAEARAGAEWAITTLYRDLHPRLLRYLRAQAPADAEDLASEVWADCAAGLARFEGTEAGFRGWLFTIARRRLIDLRRRKARRAASLRSAASTIERTESDPEFHVVGASETEAALARIASLPPAQAEVVLLRVVAGLDVENVAVILGKTPGAVHVLQHRALKRLADQLTNELKSGVSQ